MGRVYHTRGKIQLEHTFGENEGELLTLKKVSRIVWYGVAFCFVLALLSLSVVPVAHADGGAPNLAYVAGTSRGISIIDVSQQKVTGSLSITGDPRSIYLSVDGRLLAVTQPALGRVSVIGTASKQVICSAAVPGHPTLLTFDPGTSTLYAAGNGASSITAINLTNCAILRTLQVSGAVYGLAVAVVGSGIAGGTGNQLWVADANELTVFDTQGKHLDTIAVPDGPEYLCIPAGSTIYVATRRGTVEAVDLQSLHLLPTLLTAGTFGPMDYDALTGEIYVPDQQHKLIDVLTPVIAGATTPHEPARVLRFAAAPQSIAITSDGQLGFVALADGKVSMLDIPGRQVVTTISVGGVPSFIITGLYPSPFSYTPQQSILVNNIGNIVEYGGAVVVVVVTVILLLRRRRQLSKPKS